MPALNVQADIDEDLVYRAPRASTMFFDEDEAKSDKLARKIERDRKRAARSPAIPTSSCPAQAAPPSLV